MSALQLNSFQFSTAFTFITGATALVATSVLGAVGYTYQRKRRKTLTTDFWPIVKAPLFIRLSSLFDKIHEWAELYGGRLGLFEFTLLGTRFVVACRQDRLLQLMEFRPEKLQRSARVKSVANSIGACGLFSAEGEQWQADRRLVVPALNRKNLREYLQSMKIVSQRLVAKWSRLSKLSEGGVVPVNHDLYSHSVDVLSLAVYGKDANTLESISDQTSKDVVSILDIGIIRMFSPIRYWEIPVIGPYLDGGAWIKARIIRALDEMITRHCQEKQDNDTTFLGKILALNQQFHNRLPRERLIGQLITLFLGGSDSVGTSLYTALWLLASDQELQEELVCELLSSRFEPEHATMEFMMEKLPRMRSFFMELSRCYSPTPLIFLGAKEDLNLGPMSADGDEAIIPKGTEVILLGRAASLHPSSPPSQIPLGPFSEPPSDFCPHRWLIPCNKDEQVLGDSDVRLELPSIKSGVHMSFGHGQRACPGRYFAELEVITCVAHVLLEFKVSLMDTGNAALHQMHLALLKRSHNDNHEPS